MKYYKTPKFAKVLTSTGFITVTACFLIAIGAISWFALSRSTKVEAPKENNSQKEYIEDNNSYNENIAPDIIVEQPSNDVNESLNNIPYENDNHITTSENPKSEKQNFILPIEGNISKGYSDTALQYSATYGDMRVHMGVDILCDKGSNIKSVGSGVVKSVTEDIYLGKIIEIIYDEKITVKYCGMDNVNVKQNDKIAIGDIIGTSGDVPSECIDNPHIHIEAYVDGQCTSPLMALDLE